MIFNLRLLSTALGITVSLGIAWPLLLGQQHLAIAQPTTTKKFKPRLPPPPPNSADSRGFPRGRGTGTAISLDPPQIYSESRGFPGRRDAAINRACPSIGTKLVALAPEFVQTAEKSVWGQTTQAHPTLWFFVAAVDRSAPLEFYLQDRNYQVIYKSVIPAPLKDGVIGVKIPQSQQPLVLDRHYRWTLKAKFACGDFAPEQRYVDGWIQRVGLPAGIDIVNNPVQSYVDRGIWYDAVTSLAERRLKEPNNVQLRQDWRELLGSVKLEEFAPQPLLK